MQCVWHGEFNSVMLALKHIRKKFQVARFSNWSLCRNPISCVCAVYAYPCYVQNDEAQIVKYLSQQARLCVEESENSFITTSLPFSIRKETESDTPPSICFTSTFSRKYRQGVEDEEETETKEKENHAVELTEIESKEKKIKVNAQSDERAEIGESECVCIYMCVWRMKRRESQTKGTHTHTHAQRKLSEHECELGVCERQRARKEKKIKHRVTSVRT